MCDCGDCLDCECLGWPCECPRWCPRECRRYDIMDVFDAVLFACLDCCSAIENACSAIVGDAMSACIKWTIIQLGCGGIAALLRYLW